MSVTGSMESQDDEEAAERSVDAHRERLEQPERPGTATERSHERRAEDREYVPVIIKRSDEAVRHADDVLRLAIDEGLEQLERPVLSLALSALAAGMILGFSAMAVAVVTALVAPMGSKALTHIAGALVYPLGFLVCITSRTELFTEHTATAVYPVLDRRSGPGEMLRLWLVVGLGNLAGAVVVGAMLAATDPVVGAREGYLALGHHLVAFESAPLFASAVLAGWLMALGGWLILATPAGVAQIVVLYVVVFLIGLGGLHHSIAGSVELFTALFVGAPIGSGEVARFLTLALLGNLFGGSVFVAVLNYGHIRQSQGLN